MFARIQRNLMAIGHFSLAWVPGDKQVLPVLPEHQALPVQQAQQVPQVPRVPREQRVLLVLRVLQVLQVLRVLRVLQV